MDILYTASDVHRAIKNIFSTSCDRRVVIVAYLGINAENYLPNPKNMEIICCPEPGATNPQAIRNLLAKGANVKFSDGLHSKVYWSNNGCVITSANVSHRALGNAPQKETGVLIDSSHLDIDRLIGESKPYKITQSIMNKLEVQNRKITHSVGVKELLKNKSEFTDWYNSPYREPLKLGWWSDSELEASKEAINQSIKTYNIEEPQEVLNVAKRMASKNEWLLCFEITQKGIKNIDWMYVDFVVSVNASEKKAYEKEYPFQAIQVHKLSHYPIPPFSLTKEFKAAFKKSVALYGSNNIEESSSSQANKKLLALIYDSFKTK